VEAERGGPSSENWMHQYHLNHKDGLVAGGWAAWDAVTCRRDDDLFYEPDLPVTFPDDLHVYEGLGYCVYTGGNSD
jgi:gentisate 1,2-dioxygenase